MRAPSRSMVGEGRGGAGPVTVGVVVNAMGGYSRGVIRGIASFAASRGWTLKVEGVNTGAVTADLADYDGLIVQASTEADAARFAAVAVPVVNVSSALHDARLPMVITDDRAVGRLGAEHFLRLGYRSLAFYAPDSRAFAKSRHEGFSARCTEAGVTATFVGRESELEASLARLPKPLGVMGVNDRAALGVLDACRKWVPALRVPDDVAVLGVDDDELLQSLAYPPMSTVNTARDRVGFQAAELLERLLGGRASTAEVSAPMLVAPKGVVARRSTDATALADADVAEAARYIHAHAGQPISVTDVAKAAALSRRQLERRFRATTGRSLLEEISRCRVDRARQLLIDTDLTLPQVALASGFASPSYFSTVFAKATEKTPQAFRSAYRVR